MPLTGSHTLWHSHRTAPYALLTMHDQYTLLRCTGSQDLAVAVQAESV